VVNLGVISQGTIFEVKTLVLRKLDPDGIFSLMAELARRNDNVHHLPRG
jgi:hypothetical protein